MKTLDDVIEYFGGIPALSKALNIKPQAIYQWGGSIPRLRAFEIQHLTDGKILAEDLIPTSTEEPA